MTRNMALPGTSALLDDFMAAVRTYVPSGQRRSAFDSDVQFLARDQGFDAVVCWNLGDETVTFLVVFKSSGNSVPDFANLPNRADNAVPIIISPYLTPVARRLAVSAGWSYWDATGNVLIHVADPLVFVERTGAQRNPEPATRDSGLASLKGPRASRVVEYLLTTGGTTGAREITANADVALGTASRVLSLLRDENFFVPNGGGAWQVTDKFDLAQRLVEDYSYVRSNRAQRYFSPLGLDGVLMALVHSKKQFAITGLRGANEYLAGKDSAPTLAASDLWLYGEDMRELERVAQLEPDSRRGDIYVAEAPWMFPKNVYRFDIGYPLPRAYPWRIAFDLMSYPGRHASAGENLMRHLLANTR